MLGLKRLAESAEEGLHLVRGLLQVGGCPARCCRWIVQFVRQARRHGPKGNQLFPLLRIAFQVPHAVCSRAENFPGDRLASIHHPPESLFVELEQSSGLGYAQRCHPGNAQQQHGFAHEISGFVDA